MTIVNLEVVHTGQITGERLATSMMIAVVKSRSFFPSKQEERLIVGILPVFNIHFDTFDTLEYLGDKAEWYWQENMQKLSWLDSLRATRLAREWFRNKEQEEYIERIREEADHVLKHKLIWWEN